MQRLDASPNRSPLHDTATTRRVEEQALGAAAPGTLMQRAGLSLAKLARALCPHAQRVWVLAGPGNNGGDGLDAAARLRASGCSVQVHLLADRTRQGADASAALRRAVDAGVEIVDGLPPTPPACDLAIDALLGIGLTRAPEGRIAEAIELFNRCATPRVAVDLPSGLDADRGSAPGLAARATHTLTMLTLKPGLFTAEGRDLAGEVWLADLDVTVGDPPCAWLAPARVEWPVRRHVLHKGSFGDVIVIGGAPGMFGAAWLAASAALAAGAGRVYLSALDDHASAWSDGRPELMARQAVWRNDLALVRRATVVCGCGGGDAVRAALPALIAHAQRLVLDADGLNAVAADDDLRAQLQRRRGRTAATVLTPHPLEAGRMLGRSAAAVQADRLGSARALADTFGATVVLKGSGTVIAAPGLLPWVNPTGNAALATAGTGDVLAGWIGGALASLDPPSAEAVQACCAAVVALHGAAADRHGAHGPLRAGTLVEAMLAGT